VSDFQPAGFYVLKRQLSELKALSQRTGIPQSQLVREALDNLIEKYNAAPEVESSARSSG
jgi:predicted DNA-binding protein